jgi:cell wall assembly regulator SMI1
MTPLEALRELLSRRLVTVEVGEACQPDLLDPMTDAEIEALEEDIGAPIPAQVRELMRVAGGVEVDCDELAWNGRPFGQDVPGAFPCWLPILDDGAGNGWNVDIDPVTGAWGRVYYACHDPAVLVYQAPSLADFIVQFADDCCQADREGQVSDVAARLVHRVWDTGGVLLAADELVASSDPVLRRAGEQGTGGLVCDLRSPRIGDGFPWTRFGARTIITRPGPEPVWILQRPAGAKRWWRLGA